ncbi:DivIVA domain-containing protein [Streptomyces sp. BHT-5-2]|uniref:DivIVA domain-containing protein n=1 Tax=unclassified Streptomyces TaxID=2593676 RepID=UPI001C8F1C92|nr:DivIVA domain-containing protein [Streptomyces sp. BHT-5-2]QZL04896.1 DivIVA domain-containing protein [Streptomyces sp. BHT-5-2]
MFTGKARSPESAFRFELVRRGYDRGQVDAYVERLSQAGPPPSEPPAFDLVRRGYDRLQVDACIEELRARRSAGPQPGR